MEYSGAQGTLIHEKKLKSKISCQTPFKALPSNTENERWKLSVDKMENQRWQKWKKIKMLARKK